MFTENRMVRIIAGLCVMAFGVMTLLSNIWQSSIITWLWIALLAITAVTFGWLYLRERATWTITFSYIAGAVGLLVFLTELHILFDVWIAVYVFMAIAVPFIYSWSHDRSQWGLLVPAYVMAAIALMLLLMDVLGMSGCLLPAYVMFTIGVPFGVAAFVSHNTRLLFPAVVLLLIGVALLFAPLEMAGQVLPIVFVAIFIITGVLMLLPEHQPNHEPRLNH